MFSQCNNKIQNKYLIILPKINAKWEPYLTLFRMDLFGAAHGWGEAKRKLLNLAVMPYLK